MQSQRTLSNWSMLIVLAIFVTAGLLYLPSHTRTTHAASSFNSFTESVGGVIYTLTRRTNASANGTTGTFDSGSWDIKEGTTDLGTFSSNIVVTTLPNGYHHSVMKTTSTIGRIASLMSGPVDEYPTLPGFTVAQESPFGDAASINGVGSKTASLFSGGQVKQLNGTGAQGVAMVSNMRKFINQEISGYKKLSSIYTSTASNVHGIQANLGIPIPTWMVATTAFGALATTIGGIVTSICTGTRCGKNTRIWGLAFAILAVLGSVALVFGGASVTAIIVITKQAAAVAAATAGAHVAAGLMMSETAAAAAAMAAIPPDLEAALPTPVVTG